MSEQELTRIHTVPLGRAYEAPPYRRAKVAMRLIREFAKRHMKSENIKIDKEVNELIWSRGIRSPPRRIKLEMSKDADGVVTIKLASNEKES